MSDHDLKMPIGPPRVPPLDLQLASPLVNAAHDKSIRTWGIPNNLFRTMAWSPQLGLTIVDYANSFIFDRNFYSLTPQASGDASKPVLFPDSGFVDRVTKELVINYVSLLNKSRYSITHHTLIGWFTLVKDLPDENPKDREKRAEEMLLHLVSSEGKPDYEGRVFSGDGHPLYSPFQVLAFRLGEKMRQDAHLVTNEDFDDLLHYAKDIAKTACKQEPLLTASAPHLDTYTDAYAKGVVVELMWLIGHFAGLLNHWFTALRVPDEPEFVDTYNKIVPVSVRKRNNGVLGATGWGE